MSDTAMNKTARSKDVAPSEDLETSDDLASQREKIEHERDELGHTVEALVDKFNVPARTKAAIESAKTRIRDAASERRALVLAAAGAAVLCVVALSWWRRRRS
jgi:Protein of unknown function (DUF3618)